MEIDKVMTEGYNYCPYCGDKLQHKIETDSNSPKECKSYGCKLEAYHKEELEIELKTFLNWLWVNHNSVYDADKNDYALAIYLEHLKTK